MRTPGRCTNHESCWLANGGRDIWVPVGDDFVCPVCAAPLTAPSLHAISTRSLAVAAAASLALVALAGGAGFGLVRALTFAAHGPQAQQTAMHQTATQTRMAAQQSAAPRGAVAVASIRTPPPVAPAPAPAPAAPKPTSTPAPTMLAAAAPPPASPAAGRAEPTNQVAQAAAPAPAAQPQKAASLPPKPEVTQALFVKAPPAAPAGTAPIPAANAPDNRVADATGAPIVAPVRPAPTIGALPQEPRHIVVTQAITDGRPPGPEGGGIDSTGRWRHRAAPLEQRSGFLPGPGWTQADEETVAGASQPYAVAQGDGDESAVAPAPGFDNGAVVPNVQNDTEVTQTTGASGASIAPQTVPRLDGSTGVQMASDATASLVTRLMVPSMAARAIAEAPAQRVDVAAADAIDDAPDAPVRLAQLPRAAPADLVLPEYPPVADDLQKPGRVNVGCTITVRGKPSDCAVTREVGGRGFADAVLTWLHSGEVRYRPHLEHGRPVPESRLYDVKFVP